MGSALAALEGRDPATGSEKVKELIQACDTWLDLRYLLVCFRPC